MSPDENLSRPRSLILPEEYGALTVHVKRRLNMRKSPLLILAMAPRSVLPALIPIVGVGLREHAHTLHRQAREVEAQEHAMQIVLLNVQSTKMSKPLGFWVYIQVGGKNLLTREKVPRRS